MCGIVGIVGRGPVNQLLYDGLLLLQHRGEDAAGIVTSDGNKFHLRKNNGMVSDVFRSEHMAQLHGNMGIGHVRYPTAGCSTSAESQPFYMNSPYGIALAHNGNLTNADDLKAQLYKEDMRPLIAVGGFDQKVYSLHELTRQFLAAELRRGWQRAASDHGSSGEPGPFRQSARRAGEHWLAYIEHHRTDPLALERKRDHVLQALSSCYRYAEAWSLVVRLALAFHDHMERRGFWESWEGYLALALQSPVDAIVSDGGAATDVRRKLSTNPEILEGKKVVIWEFVQRDIALGRAGWDVSSR